KCEAINAEAVNPRRLATESVPRAGVECRPPLLKHKSPLGCRDRRPLLRGVIDGFPRDIDDDLLSVAASAQPEFVSIDKIIGCEVDALRPQPAGAGGENSHPPPPKGALKGKRFLSPGQAAPRLEIAQHTEPHLSRGSKLGLCPIEKTARGARCRSAKDH